MKHSYSTSYGRVILCPLSHPDSEKLRLLRNQNSAHFFDKHEISAEDQNIWYSNYLNDKYDYMFSIYTKNPWEWVGTVGIYHVDTTQESAEFGRLLIDKTSTKYSGLGVDATLAACTFAFTTLHLKKLYLNVFENNIPAIKTYQKCGFVVSKEIHSVNETNVLYMEKHI